MYIVGIGIFVIDVLNTSNRANGLLGHSVKSFRTQISQMQSFFLEMMEWNNETFNSNAFLLRTWTSMHIIFSFTQRTFKNSEIFFRNSAFSSVWYMVNICFETGTAECYSRDRKERIRKCWGAGINATIRYLMKLKLPTSRSEE